MTYIHVNTVVTLISELTVIYDNKYVVTVLHRKKTD